MHAIIATVVLAQLLMDACGLVLLVIRPPYLATTLAVPTLQRNVLNPSPPLPLRTLLLLSYQWFLHPTVPLTAVKTVLALKDVHGPVSSATTHLCLALHMDVLTLPLNAADAPVILNVEWEDDAIKERALQVQVITAVIITLIARDV